MQVAVSSSKSASSIIRIRLHDGNTILFLNWHKFALLLLQISTNGLISFREGFLAQDVQPFIEVDSFTQTFIAPYWANFASSPDGVIHYRISNSSVNLEEAKNIITDTNSDLCEFEPALVVVVTWDGLVLPTFSASVSFTSVHKTHTIHYIHTHFTSPYTASGVATIQGTRSSL